MLVKYLNNWTNVDKNKHIAYGAVRAASSLLKRENVIMPCARKRKSAVKSRKHEKKTRVMVKQNMQIHANIKAADVTTKIKIWNEPAAARVINVKKGGQVQTCSC